MTQMLQATKPLNLAWMTGWCAAVGLFGIINVPVFFVEFERLLRPSAQLGRWAA